MALEGPGLGQGLCFISVLPGQPLAVLGKELWDRDQGQARSRIAEPLSTSQPPTAEASQQLQPVC